MNTTAEETTTLRPEAEVMKFVLHIIRDRLFYVVAGFGFIGNTLSIVISTKKEYRKVSTYAYMTAIAVEDTLLLINILIYITVRHDKYDHIEKLIRYS